MKESYWAYWLVVLGVFVIVVLLLVQSFTSTNTQDYYLVKSITEASMADAVDLAYYQLYGEVKINKEKFYEVFLRRFAEEASIATTYDIEFTEVYEAPPKVGVKVSSKANAFSVTGDSETFDIVNRIDMILESQSKVQGSETTGEYAASASELIKLFGTNDVNSKNQLSNCKTKFSSGRCETSSNVELEVVQCGTMSEETLELYGEYKSGEVYCIAKKKIDDTCTVTATFNQFKDNYCS